MARDILTEDGDLMIVAGDFVAGESDVQNLDDLAMTNQGELKYDPLTGMNLVSTQKKRVGQSDIKTLVRRQLKEDGWINTDVYFEGAELTIKGERSE